MMRSPRFSPQHFRTAGLLFFAGLLLPLLISRWQPNPGYLDADYYFAGGLRLATGHGFTEPFIWNYLEDPQALSHPSHGYWMPLASMLAAAGMLLAGQATYVAARVPFLLIGALVPVVTYVLAIRLTGRRDLALVSGLLAVLTVFHSPFIGVTDNFGVFMLLGGVYFLLALQPRRRLWIGVVCGLMVLARADGLLWLAMTASMLVRDYGRRESRRNALADGIAVLAGFSLVMGPWFVRNSLAFGGPLAPGGGRVLWLGEYEQIFTYPASLLSFESWLASGWQEILSDRVWALGQNLQNAVAAHGAIVLFPLIALGIRKRWGDLPVRVAVLGWLTLFLVMSVMLPFPGARGGFFHAGSAFQPMWWTLAPVGLESLVDAARKRGWFSPRAQVVFRLALLQIVALLTLYVAWMRIARLGWDEGERLYPRVEATLVAAGARPGDAVIVRNPAGYFITTGRAAAVLPYGGPEVILEVADRYGARFVVLERSGTLPQTRELYESPGSQRGLTYLGDVGDARLFEISDE